MSPKITPAGQNKPLCASSCSVYLLPAYYLASLLTHYIRDLGQLRTEHESERRSAVPNVCYVITVGNGEPGRKKARATTTTGGLTGRL